MGIGKDKICITGGQSLVGFASVEGIMTSEWRRAKREARREGGGACPAAKKKKGSAQGKRRNKDSISASD